MRFQESIYPLSNFLSDPTMLQKSWPNHQHLGMYPKTPVINWDKFANLILLSPDFSVNQQNHQNILLPQISRLWTQHKAYPIKHTNLHFARRVNDPTTFSPIVRTFFVEVDCGTCLCVPESSCQFCPGAWSAGGGSSGVTTPAPTSPQIVARPSTVPYCPASVLIFQRVV